MIDNKDIKDFIKLLNKHKVKFLLVGGYAVVHYTEPRYTKDIDFFVEASKKNASKLIAAMTEFGIPSETLDPKLLSTKGNFFKLGRPPWRIDLITSLKGLSFNIAYKNSLKIKISNIEMRVISTSDLIKVKKIAGRPQDLIDLEKLLLTKKSRSS